MAKRRKLKRNEHRYNGRIVRKTPKQFKEWRKDRYYDRRLRVWIKGAQVERAEVEELEPQVYEPQRDYKQEMIDKFDTWAKDNMKGYGFSGRREILSALEKTPLSEEHNGTLDLDADYESTNGKLVKLRYDPKQNTLKIVLNEMYKYEV